MAAPSEHADTPAAPDATVVDALITAIGELPEWPGPGTLPAELTAEIGCTERAVRGALARLEAEGLIIWHRKRPGRPRRPGYRVEALRGAWEEAGLR